MKGTREEVGALRALRALERFLLAKLGFFLMAI